MQILQTGTPWSVRFLLAVICLACALLFAQRLGTLAADLEANAFVYAAIALAISVVTAAAVSAFRTIAGLRSETGYTLALGIAAALATAAWMLGSGLTSASKVFLIVVLCGCIGALVTARTAPRTSFVLALLVTLVVFGVLALVVYLSVPAASITDVATRREQAFAVFPVGILAGALAAAMMLRPRQRKHGAA